MIKKKKEKKTVMVCEIGQNKSKLFCFIQNKLVTVYVIGQNNSKIFRDWPL